MKLSAPEWHSLEETIPRNIFFAEVPAWLMRFGVVPKGVHVHPMLANVAFVALQLAR